MLGLDSETLIGIYSVSLRTPISVFIERHLSLLPQRQCPTIPTNPLRTQKPLPGFQLRTFHVSATKLRLRKLMSWVPHMQTSGRGLCTHQGVGQGARREGG